MKTQQEFGVSFSVKQCRNFGLNQTEVLGALIDDLGVRRFRLMSYWDEHEKQPGVFDFSALDEQIDHIETAGGVVSLCLGVRQPRWPENHWPDWAWKLPKPERDAAILRYIGAVISRYEHRPLIVSYQLENEALLASFGERNEIDRERLKMEYFWVKQLDSLRPIIMTTSTSWGIPMRDPIPDIVGFSYYQVLFNNGSYGKSFHKPWLDRMRARTIKILHGKDSFIHELQAEPWGPKNIWEMDLGEQFKSMSPQQLQKNIKQAQSTGLKTIDLWGAEWWYWLKTQKKSPEIWDFMKTIFNI